MESVADRIHAHEKARERAHKSEARRKFIAKVFSTINENKGKIAAVALAAGIAVEGYNFFKGEAKDPNAFANRTIEITDQTVLRSTPKSEDPSGDFVNTIKWQDVEAIKTQSGEWINKQEGKPYKVVKPAVYMKNEDRPELFWYVLDAKVKGLIGDSEEKIYISGEPSQSEGVKITEPGQIYMLGGNSGTDWTGTVTITNH